MSKKYLIDTSITELTPRPKAAVLPSLADTTGTENENTQINISTSELNQCCADSTYTHEGFI